MKNFAEKSSIHGINFIFSSEHLKILRILWTFAFLLSFCGFSYYVYSAYIKWQVDPEIIMKARDRNSSEFPAPAITICSNVFAKNNSASFHKSLKVFIEKSNVNFTKEECEIFTANINWCQPSFGKLAETLCGHFNIQNLNALEIITKSSLTVEEAFCLCRNGNCDNSIFRIFTDFGICYTMNMMTSSMIFNTDVIHDDFKKIVTRFDNESEPLWSPEKGYKSKYIDYPVRAVRGFQTSLQPYLSEVDKENICALSNFRIYFHKPNEILTPYHESIYLNYEEYMEFKIVPKSHKTDLALKEFAPEIRKCYFEGERKLRFFKTYTKALCEWECKANLTLKICGCVKFSMPRDQNTKICNISELFCISGIDELQCKCYAPCIDVKYTYKMDKTQFNRNLFETKIPKTSAVSWVEFIIDTEIVEEIENFLSYKLQNFISDFGGLLGLFMGCSLLSFVEIFSFMINGCIKVWKTRNVKVENKVAENEKWAIKFERKISLADVEKKFIEYDTKITELIKTVNDIKTKH